MASPRDAKLKRHNSRGAAHSFLLFFLFLFFEGGEMERKRQGAKGFGPLVLDGSAFRGRGGWILSMSHTAASASLPNMTSTKGRAAAIWSPKNWIRKGAERFMHSTFCCSTQCLPAADEWRGGGARGGG